MITHESFLVRPPKKDNRTTTHCQLFCFPYAGVGASAFRDCLSYLDSSIEPICIQLPGRESRIQEASYCDMDLLVADLAVELAQAIKKPFIFWGHSMGAVIAYEAIKKLMAIHPMPPQLFIASGRQAPYIQGKIYKKSVSEMNDHELIDHLISLNNKERSIYENADLVALILPRIRADFTVLENYSLLNREKLNCPISVLHGSLDHMVSLEGSLAWGEYTDLAFKHEIIEGGHFFIHEQVVDTMNSINLDCVGTYGY